MIFVNDEHLPKEYDSIDVTEEGILICVNEEHPSKAIPSIEFTEEGIMIRVNDEQFENDSLLIVFIVGGMTTLIKFLLFLKHLSSIACTFVNK